MNSRSTDRAKREAIARAAVARFIEIYKGKANQARERMKDKEQTPKTRALLRTCYALAKDRL